jgi:hypothetical protein
MADKIFRTKQGLGIDLEDYMADDRIVWNDGIILRAEFGPLNCAQNISSKNPFCLMMTLGKPSNPCGSPNSYLGSLQFTDRKTINEIFAQYQEIHNLRTLHVQPEVLNQQAIRFYYGLCNNKLFHAYGFSFK